MSHNTGLDILYGPFTAETDAGLIEPNAWNGMFRWQVRVSWNRIFKLTNASQAILYLIEKYKFSDREGEEILKTLEERGVEIATPQPKPVLPENILSNVRSLDEEIHRLAHRIEECLMSQKKHPADREVDLDVLKAKFCAKMRDFVWAVRWLDKTTGIMGLPSNKKGR